MTRAEIRNISLKNFLQRLYNAKGLSKIEQTCRVSFLEYVDIYCDMAYKQTKKYNTEESEIFKRAFIYIWVVMAKRAYKRNFDILEMFAELGVPDVEETEDPEILQLPDVE